MEPGLASAVCCTYRRPDLLEEAIRCFELQTYPQKELVILNDDPATEYRLERRDDRIRIVNAASRLSSLGAKRNLCCSLARGEFIFVWDDDDLYTPWRMASSISALRAAPEFESVKATHALWTVHNEQPEVASGGMHSQICIRHEALEQTRYDEGLTCGEDQELESRLRVLLVAPEPSYWMICRWGLGVYHISGQPDLPQSVNWQLAEEQTTPIVGHRILHPRFRDDHFGAISNALQAISSEAGEAWTTALQGTHPTRQ